MNNLKLLRQTHGLSQKDLAMKLRIRVVDLSRLENNWYRRMPKQIENRLKELFGPNWTAEALLQEVAKPAPPGQSESPGAYKVDELRKAG